MNKEWTILNMIQWTTDYFKERNIPNPRLDSECLLAHVLNRKRLDLYLKYDELLSKEDLIRYKELILKRGSRYPLHYILNEKEFMSLKFFVHDGVLIPRFETELLVEYLLKLIRETPNDSIKLLEIGSGTGAISISLAHYAKNISKIIATDISEKALINTKTNVEFHHYNDKISILHSDLFEDIPKEKFDFIVSNPPYIRTADLSKLQDEIKKFEPIQALDGGADGLQFYREILTHSRDYLTEKGTIALEIGEDQSKWISQLCIENKFSPTVFKDYSGLDRIIFAKREIHG